jgi:hypothetical protein
MHEGHPPVPLRSGITTNKTGDRCGPKSRISDNADLRYLTDDEHDQLVTLHATARGRQEGGDEPLGGTVRRVVVPALGGDRIVQIARVIFDGASTNAVVGIHDGIVRLAVEWTARKAPPQHKTRGDESQYDRYPDGRVVEVTG